MMGRDGCGQVEEPPGDELRALRAEVAALRERNAALEALFEATDAAAFVKDRLGRYRLINAAGARLLGRSTEEIIGRDAAALFSAESARRIAERDDRILAEGAGRTIEELTSAAGDARTYRAIVVPYRDGDGAVAGVAGLARDVTGDRRTEEELREHREFLSRLLDHSPAPIYITGHDGRFLLANPACAEIWSRSCHEVVGRPLAELCDPETAGAVLERNRRVAEAEAPLVFEEEVEAPDGRRCYYTVKFPLRDADGRVAAVGGISLNITKRKRAEEALARDALLLASVRDSVIVTDPDGIVTYWNEGATRLFGWTAAEMIGRHYADRFPEPARTYIAEEIRRRGAGTEWSAEYEDYRKDGSRVWIDARVGPVVDADGRVVCILGLAYDITDRKRAEAALRDSTDRLQVLSRRVVEIQEEERRHLARELHDEIGQSLTAIAVNLHALKRACSPEGLPRVEDCLAVVQAGIQQVRGLALELRPSMLDDLGLVAALRWYVNAQARRVGYEARFAAHPAELDLGPSAAIIAFRVAQEALTNVARHAEARRVRVWLRVRAGVLHLVVRDDGVGFDPEATLRRDAEGHGMGLLGMRERAALLGGRVGFRSIPGRRTEVHLVLPLDRGREGG